MSGTEDAWKALNQTHDLIKVADTKAGAILASAGVLGAAVVRALPATSGWHHKPWHVALLLVSMVLVGVSILFALRVFTPRLRMGESGSLLHFDNIARRYAGADEFSVAYRALFEHSSRLHKALAEQLWATSRIARRKFRSVGPAIWFFGAALVVALVAGLLSA